MSDRDAVRTLKLAAQQAGVQFEIDENLDAFAKAKAELGKGEVTRIFEADRTIGPGFWLPIREIADGQLVGLQAVRLWNENFPDLWTHMLVHRDLYPPVGMPIDPERSEIHSAVAREMNGSIAYHGEFYLLPTTQGRGLGPILLRLAQVVASVLYAPDILFGLTGTANTNPRFAHKMGYQSFEPNAVTWRDGDGSETEIEGLVWSGRARLRQLCQDPLGDLEVAAPAVRRVGLV